MDRYLQSAAEMVEHLITGVDQAKLDVPLAGKWSAANTLEHLARAFGATHKNLERRLADRHAPPIPPASLSQRLGTFLVVTLGYVPSGRKAPEITVPTGAAAAKVLPIFHANLADLDATITRCEERFGDAKVSVHPILGPLTAGQWRKFHWVHTRHHVRQIASRLRA